MADPQLPGIFRAQVRLPGVSGLPEDVYINSFAFRNTTVFPVDPNNSMADAIQAQLTAFYQGLRLTLSGAHIVEAEMSIRVYALEDATPRIPYERPLVLTDTMGTGASFPAEVCSVLSFYSERNLPRNRGRIFIGPLLASAGSFSEHDVRLTNTARDAILASAENLIASSENSEWGIVSQADGDFKPVTAGWIDNAFDTQRRRGSVATQRTTWPRVV